MSRWKSTLGRDLRPEDEAKIEDRWGELRAFARDLDGPFRDEADPVEMLNTVTEIIILGHSLRAAINEAWFQANKTIGHEAPRKRDDLEALLSGLTDEQIAEALKGVQGSHQ